MVKKSILVMSVCALGVTLGSWAEASSEKENNPGQNGAPSHPRPALRQTNLGDYFSGLRPQIEANIARKTKEEREKFARMAERRRTDWKRWQFGLQQ